MKYDTIDNVVRDICAVRGDLDASVLYTQVARMVKRVVEQLNLHLFPNLKSEYMVVSDQLTIDLNPDETEFVTKVGAATNNRLDVIPYSNAIINREQTQYVSNKFPPCECVRTANATVDANRNRCCYYWHIL